MPPPYPPPPMPRQRRPVAPGRGAARSWSDERRDGNGSGFGRVVLLVLLSLLVLVGGGLGLLLSFPPTGLVRDKLVAEVERQTGRKLTIGSAGLSFFSGLGVTLSDVTLSAPPSMGGAPLLKADGIDVRIALLPFVMREVEVERLVLRRPRLDLRVDDKGRRSWDFAAQSRPSRRLKYAQSKGGQINDASQLPPELKDFVRNASPPRAVGKITNGLGLEGLTLADVQISDGSLRYVDQRAGVLRDVSGINMRLSMPGIGGRLSAKGDFLIAGERIGLDGQLDTVHALMAEQTVKIDVKLQGAQMSAHYGGALATGAVPAADGDVEINVTSASQLVRLIGVPVGGLDGFGAVKVSGKLKGSAADFALSSAEIGVGPATAGGAIRAKFDGPRPSVTADLRIAGLDLDRLAAAGAAVEASGPSEGAAGRFAAPAAAGLPEGGSGKPNSIDDLLKRSVLPPQGKAGGPQVRGFRQRAGNQWDVEAIDSGALKAVDLDGRFHIVDARWRGVVAQDVRLAAELKAGQLRATISEAEIAGGKARMLLNVDGRGQVLSLGANFSADGVALAPLLKAAGVDLLEGRGRAVVTLSAKGGSERELISSLGGRADIKASDGALIGWNAEAMLANLRRGEMPSTQRIADARTGFRLLAASFVIADGVARTRDINLDSPSLHAKGTGVINIVDRNLDLDLRPKAVGGGIEIPVRVAGDWDAPKVIPDIQGALNSPQAQEAVRHLRDGNVDGALRSVLGNGPKAEKKIEKAKDFLKQFLSR
ncbi:MAG: AsmA family protein [Hyphomicrobiaceae bacterium]